MNLKTLPFFLLFFSAFVFSQNSPPEISVVGNQVYCADAPIPIVTSVSITDSDINDTTLDEVFVQIAEGYETGQDELFLGGTHPNITSNWNVSEGILNLIGPATFAEFENAIENTFFQTTQTNFTQDRGFTINLGNANYLPSTGHYYFYVSDPGVTWTQARDGAAAQNYFGLQGYLATITTEEESQLAGEQTSGTGWIGASDAEIEGTWKWVTGPEAGTEFWQGTGNGTPVNGEYSFWNTNEPNNAGDEDYAHITSPGIGILGSWNDLSVTGDTNPSGSYHPQGYIVEFGGLPNEPQINLSANSTLIMPILNTEDIEICGEGNITVSASSSTGNIIWYSSETSTTPIHSGLIYDVFLNATTTFWLAPEVIGCSSNLNRTPLTVTVNPLPEVSDITIVQCEDEVIDGISTFNLNAYIDAIVTTATADMTVQFFEDSAATISIDEQNFTNENNNQVIYAVATDNQSQCSAMAEVLLNVNSSVPITVTLSTCDSLEETGVTDFDLTVADNLILGNQPTGVEIEGYFESYNDALLLQNALGNSFSNSQPYNQTIFARLVQNGNCYSIAEVELKVEELPSLLEDEDIYYCLNTFPETISLYGGIVNDVPNNYYYNWSTGETTIEIEVNEPGTYTVEITKPFGCTNQRTITVLPSNTATVESIEVNDISDNNTVSVVVSGEGDYTFSLDDINGTYQDSNTFTNVSAGIHTVYIKDMKGNCGIVSEQISVIGYPRFFTPNGDTVNDTWRISGFSSEFQFTGTVEIYNRYGKLIEILNPNNPEWDGSYNGKALPTDDYWFIAKFLDGRSMKGHFTLKN